MFKKMITYTDYNGVERKENFYFNLEKSELLEMELGVTGGLRELLQLLIEKQDIPKLMKSFKDIILKSYGEKSADGRVFNKSEALSDAFYHTKAYSNLYMELLSDANSAAAFINGLIPEDEDGEPMATLTPIPAKEQENVVPLGTSLLDTTK